MSWSLQSPNTSRDTWLQTPESRSVSEMTEPLGTRGRGGAELGLAQHPSADPMLTLRGLDQQWAKTPRVALKPVFGNRGFLHVAALLDFAPDILIELGATQAACGRARGLSQAALLYFGVGI